MMWFGKCGRADAAKHFEIDFHLTSRVCQWSEKRFVGSRKDVEHCGSARPLGGR